MAALKRASDVGLRSMVSVYILLRTPRPNYHQVFRMLICASTSMLTKVSTSAQVISVQASSPFSFSRGCVVLELADNLVNVFTFLGSVAYMN